MSADLDPLDDDVAPIVDRLQAEHPRAGRGLRRRVQAAMGRALRDRHLRRRAVVLISGGSLVLAVAGWLAVTAPA